MYIQFYIMAIYILNDQLWAVSITGLHTLSVDTGGWWWQWTHCVFTNFCLVQTYNDCVQCVFCFYCNRSMGWEKPWKIGNINKQHVQYSWYVFLLNLVWSCLWWPATENCNKRSILCLLNVKSNIRNSHTLFFIKPISYLKQHTSVLITLSYSLPSCTHNCNIYRIQFQWRQPVYKTITAKIISLPVAITNLSKPAVINKPN